MKIDITALWKEDDETAEVSNDLARLDLEAHETLLTARISLGDIKREYQEFLRSCQGMKGSFKTILSYTQDIKKAEQHLDDANDVYEEFFGKAK